MADRRRCGIFDALNVGVESFIDSFQLALYAIPFYVFIPLTVLLVWWKVGKGMGAFTLLGLLLIWGMGFWEETMQTLALVLSSTCMALLIGIPLGIWAGKVNAVTGCSVPFWTVCRPCPLSSI